MHRGRRCRCRSRPSPRRCQSRVSRAAASAAPLPRRVAGGRRDGARHVAGGLRVAYARGRAAVVGSSVTVEIPEASLQDLREQLQDAEQAPLGSTAGVTRAGACLRRHEKLANVRSARCRAPEARDGDKCRPLDPARLPSELQADTTAVGRARGGRARRTRKRAEGSDRRDRAAHCPRQTRDQEAPRCNPATGERITIAAKPASVDVRARPLARAKQALPSVQKARRRLAA